jgi:outer membrane biosynthesis protein TonB
MIVDAYNKAQSARTPEQQARTKALETPAAPVNDNIQQPKEETPAQPVEPKKEVVKTPAQLQAEADAIRYSDNSEARLAEIANNLNNAVATNPNSLRTLDAFKSAYSYNLRSKEQQQVLNDWYSGYQKSIKL